MKAKKELTFADLIFEGSMMGGAHTKVNFPNGNYISVITGGDGPYEIMSTITEDSEDGVLGGVTPIEITEHMHKLQADAEN